MNFMLISAVCGASPAKAISKQAFTFLFIYCPSSSYTFRSAAVSSAGDFEKDAALELPAADLLMIVGRVVSTWTLFFPAQEPISFITHRERGLDGNDEMTEPEVPKHPTVKDDERAETVVSRVKTQINGEANRF